MPCIWYVSKYVALPSDKVGARSFFLMRALAGQGLSAVILTSDANHLLKPRSVKGQFHREKIDGVDVYHVRTLKYRGAKSIGRVLSWLDFEWRLWRLPKDDLPRPDAIIISSLSLLTILNGLVLRRHFNCRLVFEVRDIWPLTIVEEGNFSRWNPLVMLLGVVERLAYRRSDAIVGTMPNLGEHVEAQIGRLPPTFCVPMGVDEAMLTEPEPLPADYASEYIVQGKFIVCHAGSIGISNALDIFIECARSMHDRPDIHFLMLGEGDLKARYEKECGDLMNITFAPPVPKTMVQSVLKKCDLLYFSTHESKVWAFGQSLNKVIDYMLAEKPIVASYSGYPSMINEAGAGCFVPAGDAQALIGEIIHFAGLDPEKRDMMGAAARRWLLENRRYDKLATDYLSIALPGFRNLKALSVEKGL